MSPHRDADASQPCGRLRPHTVSAGRTVATASGVREPDAPADPDAGMAALRERLLSLRRAAESPRVPKRGPRWTRVPGELEATTAMVGKLRSGPRPGEAERPGGADAGAAAAARGVPGGVGTDLPARLRRCRRRGQQAGGHGAGRAPGPATGKPFTAFAALQDRCAVRTQPTAVLCTPAGPAFFAAGWPGRPGRWRPSPSITLLSAKAPRPMSPPSPNPWSMP